jgi:hypothetical protein
MAIDDDSGGLVGYAGGGCLGRLTPSQGPRARSRRQTTSTPHLRRSEDLRQGGVGHTSPVRGWRAVKTWGAALVRCPLRRVPARQRIGTLQGRALWEPGFPYQHPPDLAGGTHLCAGWRAGRHRLGGGTLRSGARGHRPKRPTTEGEFDRADPIREEPIVANPLEAARQDMQELCGEANYVAREP